MDLSPGSLSSGFIIMLRIVSNRNLLPIFSWIEDSHGSTVSVLSLLDLPPVMRFYHQEGNFSFCLNNIIFPLN